MKSKVMSILLSAVVAFGLWLYVITVVSPDSEKTYYEIPVVFQNKDILADRGLMIVSDTPTVTLTLKSTRTILNDLNESNINVLASVANIEKPGTHNLTYTTSFPGNVSQSDVAVQSSSTDLVTIKVENKIKKVVPIVIDNGGSKVPDGFIADLKNVQLDVTGIEVVGPESVIKQIESAIIAVDLNNQTQTLVGEYQYTLCNAEGQPVDAEMVTTNVEMVNLTLKIQQVKEIQLAVEVIDGGGATQQTSTIVIEPKTIRVSGNETLLENLEVLTIGTIHLGEMLKDQSLTFDIVLPEGITNETGVEQARVDVKFSQLLMKTLNVTNITAINVPEGLEVDMITKALEVRVRGPIAMVKNMDQTDISVRVDFAGSQLGTATMKAEIIIANEFAGVGAVGTYQVSATLKEPNEKKTTP